MTYDPTKEAKNLALRIMALKHKWQTPLPKRVAPESIEGEEFYEHQDHTLWWATPNPGAEIVAGKYSPEYKGSKTTTTRLNLWQKNRQKAEYFEIRFVRLCRRRQHNDGTVSLTPNGCEVQLKTKRGTVLTSDLPYNYSIFLHLMSASVFNPFNYCGRRVELSFQRIGAEKPRMFSLRVLGTVTAQRVEKIAMQKSVVVTYPDLKCRGKTKTIELDDPRLLRELAEPEAAALDRMLEDFYDAVERITQRLLEEAVSDRKVYAMSQAGDYQKAACYALGYADLSQRDKEVARIGGVRQHLTELLEQYYSED